MQPPADHVLRTLASAPPGVRVLDVGPTGRHADFLRALGFVVEAVPASDTLPFPDTHFAWVVAWDAFDGASSAAELKACLAEIRRVLVPGGWAIVALAETDAGADATPETLTKLLAEAGLALAEAPVWDASAGERRLRGIYRRVDEGTPG